MLSSTAATSPMWPFSTSNEALRTKELSWDFLFIFIFFLVFIKVLGFVILVKYT